jgi:hypothetical protein
MTFPHLAVVRPRLRHTLPAVTRQAPTIARAMMRVRSVRKSMPVANQPGGRSYGPPGERPAWKGLKLRIASS